MERICPFLAHSDGGRALTDGYDAAHRCRAVDPSEPIERSQQVTACLDAAHRACERYGAAMRRRTSGASWLPPAPDAEIVQTRLVVPPELPRRRLVGSAPVGASARRWAIGGALATVGVVAVASGVAGGLSSLVDGREPVASANSGLPVATTTPSMAPSVNASAPSDSITPEATVLPTQVPPTPQPTTEPTPVVTATPQPPQVQTYVVQPGDTLNGIAIRFGTTVAAIQQANGLGSSDVIVVGQVLIIP